MTCDHCCGAEKLFDDKEAKKQLRRYRKSGARGSTRKLIEQTLYQDNEARTLLDIGGGIGAIQWALLESEKTSCTDVDASGAYLETARSYSASRGWSERTHFIQADFTDVSDSIGQHDFVTLDKVVCCYPDFRLLLTRAAEKCNIRLGLSFPLGGWISILVAKISGVYFALTKNAYRPYVHSKAEIHQLMTALGFRRIHASISWPMRVWVYERD